MLDPSFFFLHRGLDKCSLTIALVVKGKVPDKSDVLTIFGISIFIKAKTVLKKLVGKVSKQHVDKFRFLTIFKVLVLTGLHFDNLIKLLLRFGSFVGPVHDVDVLLALFVIF